MNKELKCAFTGHRIIKVTEALKSNFKSEAEKMIKKGVAVFLNGGALGFDLFAASEIIKLKSKYPIKLKMILPCKDQALKWNDDQKLMYDEILYNADEVVYVSEKYENGCMQKRNKIMVDECDFLISYCTKKFGGTYYTVKYAQITGKEIINLTEM